MAESSTINKGSTVEECQDMIRRGLRTPMVKFLKEHLEKSGCRIGDNFIKAIHCDQKISGGYARGRGIRAGHLSGDCHYKRELLRGYLKIRGHEQECVKRRVMKSMSGNPNCSESASRDAMEAIWDVCYNDTKPFDRAP
uniref:Mitochondrial inner membrane protease ATP23 n=1 Tax=Solanum tuberosum TaxID=4113 RepID=M1AUF2_SOLTU